MSEFESATNPGDMAKWLADNMGPMSELRGEAVELEKDLTDVAKAKSSLKAAMEEHSSLGTSESLTQLNSKKEEAKIANQKAMDSRTEFVEGIEKLASTNSKMNATAVAKVLKLYHDKVENDRIMNIFKAAQTIDLCFVIDATGSMHMDNVFKCLKQHMRNILAAITNVNPHLKFQLSLVAYRDPEDGAKHFQIQPFTTSRTEFETKITEIQCSGGGDQCEDVIGALKHASDLQWTYCNRILFLCGDAPCHGTDYHNGCNDNHPGGLGQSSLPIMHRLVDSKVQMFFWKINNSTDKMIAKLNEEASSASGLFPEERPRDQYIETVPLDISSPEAMIDTIRKSIQASLSGSLSKSSSKASGMKPNTIKNAMKKSFPEAIKEETEEDLSPLTPNASLKSDGGLSI